MKHRIDSVARQVSLQVARGRTVAAHPPLRVSARELTIEFDPEPYPEVPAAFEEFCRITGTNGRLVRYEVRPVVGADEITARVTATIEIGAASFTGHGVDEDVVAGSVHAFAGAVAQRG